MVFKITPNTNPGDSDLYGPGDIGKIAKLLSGFDLSITDPVSINTDFAFRSSKLAIRDPANLHSYKIATTNGASGDVTITIPLPSGSSDSFVLASQSAGSGDMILASAQTVTGAKTFNDTKLLLRNPADTFSVTLGAGAQTAARTFTFPVTTSDTIQTIAATQTVTNKTISGSSNTFTNIPKSAIPSATLYNDVDNDLGAHFYNMAQIAAPSSPAASNVRVYLDSTTGHLMAKHSDGTANDLETASGAGVGDMLLGTAQTVTAAKTFQDNTLVLRNPADTFSSTVSSGAQTGTRVFTFPLTAGNDTIETRTSTSSVANKTISVDTSTINHSSTNAAGDLLKGNGTSFQRFARGTAGQVLQVNGGGTDIAWTTLGAGSGDMVLASAQTITGAKTFNDGTLLLRNPADTFSATLKSGAQTAAQTFTFPVASSDTIVLLTATQTVTNKTMTVNGNTFKHGTTNAAGDIWKSDGTSMTRFPRGTANQVLQVNSGGTDIAWQTLSAGSGDMILASAQTVTGAKTFNDGTFLLRNPADTFSTTIKSGAQTAARNITFPVLSADTTVVVLNASNTFSTGFNQRFPNNALRVQNPAQTFTYQFTTAAITADRVMNLPLLAADDTIVFEAFAQTLTNKTITAPVLGSYLDYTRIAAPANPSANMGRAYVKQIDTNNDGLFILVKKAGAYTEVQIA